MKSYCALEQYLAGLNLDTHLGIRSLVGKLSVKNIFESVVPRKKIGKE